MRCHRNQLLPNSEHLGFRVQLANSRLEVFRASLGLQCGRGKVAESELKNLQTMSEIIETLDPCPVAKTGEVLLKIRRVCLFLLLRVDFVASKPSLVTILVFLHLPIL